MPTIELLYFPDCPNVPAARDQLARALAAAGFVNSWTEHDVTAEDAPPRVRGYGSPTILVDGRDVTGALPGDGSACRVYTGGELRGAPPLENIVAALLGSLQSATIDGEMLGSDEINVDARASTSVGTCQQQCGRVDLVESRVGWLLWGVPIALFLLGIGWGAARAWLWVPSLAVAGSACIANASRCGRLHCFVTGPLFVLAALATLLDAVSLFSIDWRWILFAVIVGTAAGYGGEWVRGKYVGAGSACEGDRRKRAMISGASDASPRGRS